MEQKNITTGGVVTGAILLVCGIIILPVAIGALLAFPHFIFYGGIIMAIASGLMVYGGIHSMIKAKVEEKLAEEVVAKMSQQTSSVANPSHSPNDVLIHWIYTPDEWKKFIQWERSERKTEFIIQVLLVAILGTFLLRISRDAPIIIGLPISLLIGGLVAFLRYRLVFASMEKPGDKPYEVKISKTAFLINGKFNPFFSEVYTPENIRIIEDASPKILELRYGWKTRRGRTHEELRVPIPEGKYEEAKKLLSQIKS